jgi:hypothetical protein
MPQNAGFSREIAPQGGSVDMTGGSTRSRWGQRLGRLGDKADIARTDAVRSARDGAAIAVSTGRAQVERAQSFISFQAQRRPLAVAGLAAAVGVIIGFALKARGASRHR